MGLSQPPVVVNDETPTKTPLGFETWLLCYIHPAMKRGSVGVGVFLVLWGMFRGLLSFVADLSAGSRQLCLSARTVCVRVVPRGGCRRRILVHLPRCETQPVRGA